MTAQEFYLKTVFEIATRTIPDKCKSGGISPYVFKNINENAVQMANDLLAQASDLWIETGNADKFGGLWDSINQ